MTYFFFNENPALLGQAPFLPEQTDFSGTARAAGLASLLPDVPVKAISCLDGFIGGDIVSGLLLTGFGTTDVCELYMDLGTNCEILLNVHGKYYALSTAAGPAFERNNLSAGTPDTVKHIEFDGTIWHLTPETDTPAGYCGTALVDLLAEGRHHGFLDQFARWIKKPQLPKVLICSNSVLAELVTAKAAIESGLKLLFLKTGISAEDIDKIYIAGNFAENLNLANAVSTGILPDVPLEKFIRCGNASLAGTILCAVTDNWTDTAEKIKQNTELINPAEEPDYMRLFASAMSI